MSAQIRPATATSAALRRSYQGYVIASVALVVAAFASWALTGHPAGMMTLPLVAVLLVPAAQVRGELARRRGGQQV